MKTDCIFCEIVAKQKPSHPIYENELVYVFLDNDPDSDGHCLLIPKQHFDDFSSTDEKYVVEIARIKLLITRYLKTHFQEILGFNYISNEKPIAGQSVYHYHEHIVPKYAKGVGIQVIRQVKNNYTVDEMYELLSQKPKFNHES